MSKSYTQKTKLHISRTFNAWELSWRINSTATGKKKKNGKTPLSYYQLHKEFQNF